MKRLYIAFPLCVAAFCASSGCLFVRHNTRVEREKESQAAVQFESEQAKRYFLGGVHEMQAHKQQSNLQVAAVPFVFWYSSTAEPSNNAVYNDQITACDTNGDNLITMQEATVYRAAVAEQIRKGDQPKITSESVGPAVDIDSPKQEKVAPGPPALFRFSSKSGE